MVKSTNNIPGLHIVALSGGKDSTAMAVRLKELNPPELRVEFEKGRTVRNLKKYDTEEGRCRVCTM